MLIGVFSPFHKEMLMKIGVSHLPGCGGTILLSRLCLLLQLHVLYGKGMQRIERNRITCRLRASATGKHKFQSTLISSFLLVIYFA